MENIEITKYDNVKCSGFGELTMEAFIKKIHKLTNKYDWQCDDKNNLYIYYLAKVYKKGDNNYRIELYTEHVKTFSAPYYEYDYYNIDTGGNNYLNYELDEFSKRTKKHDFESDSYKKGEIDKLTTINENKATLSFLKKIVKGINKTLIIFYIGIILPLASMLIGIPSILINQSSIIWQIAALIFIISVIIDGGILLDSISYFKNYTKVVSLARKKIKQIKKVLGKRYTQAAKKEKYIVEDKNTKQSNCITEYMECIMNGANRLSNLEERRQVLYELKPILYEYNDKLIEINKSTQNSIERYNAKRELIVRTLNQLQPLTQKVAGLVNRDNNRKALISENEKLVQKFNDSMKKLEEEKAQACAVSRGR